MVISKLRRTGCALGGLWVLISQTFQVKQAVQALIVSGTRHLAAMRCHVAHFQWFHREQLFLPALILWTSAFFKFCSLQAATPWISSSGWFLSGCPWCTPCHCFPRGGSVVTASCFVLPVKCRLPNPPACFSSAGNQQIHKGRRNWKFVRTWMQKTSPLISGDTGGTLGRASHWGWDVPKQQTITLDQASALESWLCGSFPPPAASCRRKDERECISPRLLHRTSQCYTKRKCSRKKRWLWQLLMFLRSKWKKKKAKQQYVKRQTCALKSLDNI